MTSRPLVAMLAMLAGSITMMGVGFLLYGLLFAGLFEDGALRIPGVMRESPDLAWIILGQLGFSGLLLLVVSRRGATSFSAGAQTGAILGFLMAVGYDFAQYGTTHLWTLQATLIDPFVSGLLVASGGATIGWILGRD